MENNSISPNFVNFLVLLIFFLQYQVQDIPDPMGWRIEGSNCKIVIYQVSKLRVNLAGYVATASSSLNSPSKWVTNPSCYFATSES
jgi:hypothetical protein